mmetsp:Transcript_3054/g.3378  ORF Transcript_3054/g.3378 Transcript_3054/m.3378 type:complete len:147 (+) Transcript_3054:2445-2885(+)
MVCQLRTGLRPYPQHNKITQQLKKNTSNRAASETERIQNNATWRNLEIYTDHKNLIFRTPSVEQVLLWRLYTEQFYFTLDYLEGDKNVLGDCFIRLPRMDNKILVGKKELDTIKRQKETVVDFKTLKVPSKNNDKDEVNFVTTTTS